MCLPTTSAIHVPHTHTHTCTHTHARAHARTHELCVLDMGGGIMLNYF